MDNATGVSHADANHPIQRHRILAAIREHGSVLLSLIDFDKGCYLPGYKLGSSVPKAMRDQSIAMVVMTANGDTLALNFEEIFSDADVFRQQLIFLAGLDQLDLVRVKSGCGDGCTGCETCVDASNSCGDPEITNAVSVIDTDGRSATIYSDFTPKFRECYIFMMAGTALTIKREDVEGSQHRRLLEDCDTLIDVVNGVFHVAKSRSRDQRDLLLKFITMDRVAELSKSPESWRDLRLALSNAVEPHLLAEVLSKFNGHAHWLNMRKPGE